MKKHLMWMVCVAGLSCAFGGEAPLRSFRPEYRESDIYLPHLERIPLSGWWKLKRMNTAGRYVPMDPGKESRFAETGYADSAWEDDLVPNNLNSPFLKPHPDKSERTYGGVTWFRRNFTGPASGAGKRFILHFDEIFGDAELFLNGKKIGKVPFSGMSYHNSTEPPVEFDVTESIRCGALNTLAIRFYHSGKPVLWGDGIPNGITGRVWLDVRPPVWSRFILTTTKSNLEEIEIRCIPSSSAQTRLSGWTGEIFEWETLRNVASFSFRQVGKEEPVLIGNTRIRPARLWSPESPFLYGVRVRNAEKEITGVQRFGMRTFTVRDGNFLLNGNPVMLRGLTYDSVLKKNHGYFYAQVMNAGGFNRRLYGHLKSMNVNHLRIHSKMLPPAVYDTFDELGFIITDELDYPTRRFDSRRADFIDFKLFDNVCDASGRLLPAFIRKTKDRILSCYSHPSICTFSFGNELRDYSPRVAAMLNELYDLYGEMDHQRRPRTSSSGRFYSTGDNAFQLLRNEKNDYIDTHDYTGSIGTLPYPYCGKTARSFLEQIRRCSGGRLLHPIVNGEVVYFAERYPPRRMDPVWESVDAPQPQWRNYLQVCNEWNDRSTKLSAYWIRNWGSRGYKYFRDAGRAFHLEAILEQQRRLWPEFDGFECLTDLFPFPKSAWPFEKLVFPETASTEAMRRICAPVIGSMELFSPNRFCGERMKVRAMVVNNSEQDRQNLRMTLELLRDGNVFKTGILNFGVLKRGAKAELPFEWTLPEKEGDYQFRWSVAVPEGILNCREKRIRLRRRESLFAPIATKKKVAVFDHSSAFGTLKPFSTVRLLKAFRIPFTEIQRFHQLSEYDLLIIGNNSISAPAVAEGAEAIRKFTENGGRLLVFDQESPGRLPFLEEVEYAIAGPGQFAEVLKFGHPLFRGMDQKDFSLWNTRDFCFYRVYLRPLSRAGLLGGGNATFWGTNQFGMVAAHLKLGKGDVLLSQCEVTEAFHTDSAAAKLARNLLCVMLDDAARAEASGFDTLPPLKLPQIRPGRSFRISLRSVVNRGLSDPGAGDQAGGWTDQGPDYDLRGLKPGTHLFGRIPFEILDETKCRGKAMLVVARSSSLPFLPAAGAPIAVNRDLSRLFFLQTGAWIQKGRKEIGSYRIRYRSGAEEFIPIVSEENIADWQEAPSRKVSSADCVWSTRQGRHSVGIFAFSWKNPRKGRDEIASIQLTAQGESVIGLLAITGEE